MRPVVQKDPGGPKDIVEYARDFYQMPSLDEIRRSRCGQNRADTQQNLIAQQPMNVSPMNVSPMNVNLSVDPSPQIASDGVTPSVGPASLQRHNSIEKPCLFAAGHSMPQILHAIPSNMQYQERNDMPEYDTEREVSHVEAIALSTQDANFSACPTPSASSHQENVPTFIVQSQAFDSNGSSLHISEQNSASQVTAQPTTAVTPDAIKQMEQELQALIILVKEQHRENLNANTGQNPIPVTLDSNHAHIGPRVQTHQRPQQSPPQQGVSSKSSCSCLIM